MGVYAHKGDYRVEMPTKSDSDEESASDEAVL